MALEGFSFSGPFRAVDGFLDREVAARTLSLALAEGWIDSLVEGERRLEDLFERSGILPAGRPVLAGILTSAGVIERGGELVRLTPPFREALAYRDLLEARLWFAGHVAADMHELFGALFTDVPRFMQQARVFELFRYDRCLAVTDANLAAADRWVRYTTALTRYEAPAGIATAKLPGRGRLLDVGGNSGEFARQAVADAPELVADVFDLPVVCALGERHVGATPQAGRVGFIAGDMRGDALPGGYDAVTFKSVLHDWPDDAARSFLGKAKDALVPGGRIAIFERARFADDGRPMGYAMVANLVFLPFFRGAEKYVGWLGELGFEEIEVRMSELDMPFCTVTARRPS